MTGRRELAGSAPPPGRDCRRGPVGDAALAPDAARDGRRPDRSGRPTSSPSAATTRRPRSSPGSSPTGPFERFGRERLAAIVDFERGGAGDLDLARRAFAAIDEPGDRSVAAWQLAVEDARQRYVLGGDWRAPLEVAAGAGDPRARSVRAWLPTIAWALAPALVAIYLLALVVELVATGSIL